MVVAIAVVIGFVKCNHHPSNDGDAADDLDDAGDEEHHHRLREGVWGPLLGLAWVRAGVVGVRTAVNFPLPSSADFGAQHMRMLEATQARMPQMAPTAPVAPTPKPSIEKTELPHTCSAHEETKLAGAGAVHVSGTGKIELPRCMAGEAAHGANGGDPPTCAHFGDPPRKPRGWRTR